MHSQILTYSSTQLVGDLYTSIRIAAVATYSTTGVRVKSQRSVYQKGKCVGVATIIYSRKMLEKAKKGMWILKIRIRELFTRTEGISTPHARHKVRQPLIECAQCDFKIIYFSFLYFFAFWGRQGNCPCSYVSSGAMRNSYLFSSLSLKVCVSNCFYAFERFFLINKNEKAR